MNIGNAGSTCLDWYIVSVSPSVFGHIESFQISENGKRGGAAYAGVCIVASCCISYLTVYKKN